MMSQHLVVFVGILCTTNLMCEPQAAPYSGQPSPLLGDSQQSPAMRELSKAHAEQLARAEESIAELVRQLKALPPDDARREPLAAQLRQQQQALRDTRDKFRDQAALPTQTRSRQQWHPRQRQGSSRRCPAAMYWSRFTDCSQRISNARKRDCETMTICNVASARNKPCSKGFSTAPWSAHNLNDNQ
ncbi:uncharacterized protein LOC119442966 [Dermacentor silvarum]|uniref:uncharacterized protein LOC119442966 n=1 Tax=Dermacentor silvarum TaxID=543639 RepID=UPI001898223E|nr:uncharacterized protein LOC119442966 [Dermacentor silvarum]XP_049518440.1 uncharacterized protein LOC119442966 [Dermacentor silvarum]